MIGDLVSKDGELRREETRTSDPLNIVSSARKQVVSEVVHAYHKQVTSKDHYVQKKKNDIRDIIIEPSMTRMLSVDKKGDNLLLRANSSKKRKARFTVRKSTSLKDTNLNKNEEDK